METERRDIHHSAKTGTVTREAARVAVLAAKASHSDKSDSPRKSSNASGSASKTK